MQERAREQEAERARALAAEEARVQEVAANAIRSISREDVEKLDMRALIQGVFAASVRLACQHRTCNVV